MPMLQLGVWQCREIAQRAAPATGAGACTRRRCQSGCRMRVAACGVAYCCTEGSEESTSRNSVRVYVTYCRVLLMSLGSIEIRHSLNSLPRNDSSLRIYLNSSCMQLYSHSHTQISARPRPVHSGRVPDLPVTEPPVTIQDTG